VPKYRGRTVNCDPRKFPPARDPHHRNHREGLCCSLSLLSLPLGGSAEGVNVFQVVEAWAASLVAKQAELQLPPTTDASEA
jgi:hypothetical protein